jgi:hypothetical protein
MEKNRAERKEALMLIVVGLVIAIIGIGANTAMLISDRNFKQIAVEGEAVVVSVDTSRDSDGELQHTARISYTVRGTEYTKTIRGSGRGPRVGSIVKILYHPDKPEIMSRETSSLVYIIAYAFGAMGLFILALGIHSKVKSDREQNHEQEQKKE